MRKIVKRYKNRRPNGVRKGKLYIDFSCLDRTFPGFIWVSRVHEICGWNPETYQWIVIDDGMCWDETGQWLVHIYQLTEKDHPIEWKWKYHDNETKIAEEWYKLVWE